MAERDDHGANVEWSDAPEHLEETPDRRRRQRVRADRSDKSAVEWSGTADQPQVRRQWRGPDPDSQSGHSARRYLAAAAIVIIGPVALIALVALVSNLADNKDSPRTATSPRSTTTRSPLPTPEPDAVATATTIAVSPDTDASANGEVTAILIDAWAFLIDEHRRQNPTGWSADWCPLAELSDADLATTNEARELRRAVDATNLDPESERLAVAALLVVTRDRLDRYC